MSAENDRELVELLLSKKMEIPFSEQYLDQTEKKFLDAGFEILDAQKCFRPIRFYDVGALVWFACIIEWEFVGFAVERCLPGLFKAQELLENQGYIEGSTHIYFLAARK